DIRAKKARPASLGILPLPRELLGYLIRYVLASPDLAVRMRVAGAHQRTAIFEDLRVTNPRDRFELARLIAPGIDDDFDSVSLHRRNRQIVPGRKTYDATNSAFSLRHQNAILID